MTARETVEEYKYPILQRRLPLNTSIKWQRKLQSGIQVSELAQNCTPKCVQVLKERFFFFFF